MARCRTSEGEGERDRRDIEQQRLWQQQCYSWFDLADALDEANDVLRCSERKGLQEVRKSRLTEETRSRSDRDDASSWHTGELFWRERGAKLLGPRY
mgnify:CR=1 FL=1